MNNPEVTVVYFDSGSYSTDEENKLVWNQDDILRTLAMKTPMNDVSYIQMVTGIAKKIGIDEATTKLKMSYVPFLFGYDKPSYILEDDDVLGYLTNYKDGCRSVLHVELVQNDLDEENRELAVVPTVGEETGIAAVVPTVGEETGISAVVPTVGEETGIANNDTVELNQGEPVGLLEYPFDTVEDGGLLEESCDVVAEDGATGNGPCVGAEWDDGITDMELHQEFAQKDVVFDIIQKASHKNCFEFKVIKSCTKRLVVKCRDSRNGCKWGVRASVLKDTSCFSVRTYYKKHSCSRSTTSTSRNRRRGTARLVAQMLQKDYYGRFDTPTPKSLVTMLQAEIGCQVSYTTAWRGRKKHANYVRGTPTESYAMIYSYMYTLEKMNPGTEWAVELDAEHRFQYLYFALGVSIEGFKFMRKVLIVDAAHLKTAEGGVLIVITAQDGNHHHYPIAFGILDGEKDDSWSWFFSALKRVIPDKCELVFISDRNKGLIKGIKEVYPLAKHGFCNYHLSGNVKANAGGKNKKALVSKFLECSKAYTEGEFLHLYEAFEKKYPEAALYLNQLDDKGECKKDTWARCYFPQDRYNIDSSNPVESINGVLVGARKLSILPMIDAILKTVTRWFCEHRTSSAELVGAQKLVPYVDNVMHNLCAEAQTLTVSDVNCYYQLFSVVGRDGRTYLVDLKTKTCTCKHFDIDKYPCVHGIAAAIKAQIDLDTLCSKYYGVHYWSMAYTQSIFPVPHSSEWVIPEHLKGLYSLPPAYPKKKKRRGRRQERRFPSTGEYGRRSRRNRSRAEGLGRWFEPVPTEGAEDV